MSPIFIMKTRVGIVFLILLSSSISIATDVPFSHVVLDSEGPKDPWAKMVGDINGDGFLDVIIGGRSGPLVWYSWPHWTETTIAKGGYKTVDGEAGDVDGDGDLDIVMGGLIWYENPRPHDDSAKDIWKAHKIANHPTHDIELGDLDKDGDLDIVTRDQSEFGHKAGNKIHIWRQDGASSWTEKVIDCPHGEGITLADIDKDGDSDIVIGGIWFENTRDIVNGQWSAHRFASWHSDATIQIADINGDALPDIVLSPAELKGSFYKISWFEAPSDPKKGDWPEHIIAESIECVIHGLVTADINGDGSIDVVSSEMHQSADPDEVAVYLNQGSGLSWNKQIISTRGSHYIQVGDIGNDGDMDIIGANWSGNYQPIEMWENKSKARIRWERKTLPGPNSGNQQTACIVADLDKDGIDDFVVTERTQTPSVVWYKYNGKSWDMKIIDNTHLKPEAGGDTCDIDRDGDLDVIFGQDASGNKMWWWENPYPVFSRQWTRHTIKNADGNKHHDQTVGDFDGDGKLEFVSWNQRARKLLLYEIPSNPKQTGPWPSATIYSWSSGREREGFPSIPMDIDLDGKVDILGGGRWFKHQGGTQYDEHVIDAEMAFTQCAVGQLVKGGRPEVVFSPGDMNGDVRWYEWNGQAWIPHTLRYIIHGHTCEIRDIDNDGNPDIFIGEMGKPGAGDNAKTYIWYGNGKGSFIETIASHGQGIHEGKLADLDGDGDLDILMKPYNHNSPRVDVLLNKGVKKVSLDKWERHFIDDLPKRAMFVQGVDVDCDGHKDLVAGGWWWKNPGKLSGTWKQRTIGKPLMNMAIVHDFDGDGDPDILGTEGVGADKNTTFVWAQNNGKGEFSILKNINYSGGGDFLQGCTVGRIKNSLQVALSWHRDGGGIHALNIPSEPAKAKWTSTLLSTTVSSPPQGEDLDYGDIDRDGDLDLLLGDVWLRNDGAKWTTFRMGKITEGEPDRVDLADVNGDGRLDAVVSLENGTDVWWFEAPEDPTEKWKRHKIDVIDGQGFSMDTADFDGDGDPDVVIGEHRGKQENRVVLFENVRAGNRWKQHVIDKSPKNIIDHHDGTQAVDLDGDGDLDIISIGWYNPKVWVFENL